MRLFGVVALAVAVWPASSRADWFCSAKEPWHQPVERPRYNWTTGAPGHVRRRRRNAVARCPHLVTISPDGVRDEDEHTRRTS